MKIEKNNFNSDYNFYRKEEKGNPIDIKREENKIDVASSKVLESYGRAMIKRPMGIEDKICSDVERIKEKLNQEFQGDDKRSQQLLRLYNEALNSVIKNADRPETISSNFLKEGTIEIAKALLDFKQDNGEYFLSPMNIIFACERISGDIDIDAIKDFLALKNEDGEYIFKDGLIDGSAVMMLSTLTNDNIELAKKLVTMETCNGLSHYPNGFNHSYEKEYLELLKLTTKENIDVISELCDVKGEDGCPRIGADGTVDLASLIDAVNKENIDYAKQMLSATSNSLYRKFAISYRHIADILPFVSSENGDVLPLVLKRKDEYLFKLAIIKSINKDNKEFAVELFNEKGYFGDFKYPIEVIEAAIPFVNKENFEAVKKILELTDANGTSIVTRSNANAIFKKFNTPLAEATDKMVDNSGRYRFSGMETRNLFDFTEEGCHQFTIDIATAKDKYGNFRLKNSDIFNLLHRISSAKSHGLNAKGINDVVKTYGEIVNAKDKNGEYLFNNTQIMSVTGTITANNTDYIRTLISACTNGEITPDNLIAILDNENDITYSDVKSITRSMGKITVDRLNRSEFIAACKFRDIIGKDNINEIPIARKKAVLRSLVSYNSELFNLSDEFRNYFPMLPKNQEEYCELLPSLVKSLGIETNELDDDKIKAVNEDIVSLSDMLAKMDDEEFKKLTIGQEYSTDEFIIDAFNIVKDLDPKERQKVYDYFGFELHHNKNGIQVDDNSSHCFSITGYPVNLNNGKKLAQITHPNTKRIVEQLRPYVVKYSENNKINSNNHEIEKLLNGIIEAFPELRPEIGKKQNSTHKFDLFKHTLKVMQKIAQNPEFNKLDNSSRQALLLASVFHDITKGEVARDKAHHNESSSFDAYYILKKMKLPKETESKIYSLINSHEWFSYVNSKKAGDTEKRLQSAAFDLQYGNLFELAQIFTVADMKAVKYDDEFFYRYEDDYNNAKAKIEANINELKKSQPLLPTTKMPKASRINEAITTVNADGSTNIKGVYKDKNGLIVLKFNEIEEWETIGFPKGSTSRGIKADANEELSENVDTGNIKFFIHGLNYSNQLAKFEAFALPDSNALLSVSYTERPESKYRFFRPQGVILDTDAKYVHGGGKTDAGSGCGKKIQDFKNDYIFGGRRESDRTFVSDLIKTTLNFNDEEYIEFVKKNANKTFGEIEPEDIRNKLIKSFASINSHTRRGNRAYNEMYVSNPELRGAFAYSIDSNEKIGNPIEFLNRDYVTEGEIKSVQGSEVPISVKDRTEFLQQYALSHDMPFTVFGD